ncbi:S9 family peptidase [Halorientalis brevis]|uniref:S9 family peptidase n=1 Tax=Halorientalis brevis TaxID=1126241 RepID=A0ABD6C9J3_9EURY|nr:S9 family peptidase [Halorientalis brevis]
MHDLERYLNIRSAYGASVGPVGTLAFLMDTTGTPQIWTLDEPGAWPEQRTFDDERVTFCSWSPERRELAFGMDEGGDEFTQLFRLDADDGTIHPLTDVPDAIHYWGGWSHDGEQFAFAANRRDESVFDVYVQDRDECGDEADLIYEGDGWLAVAGWSPDDDRLIVSEHHSSFDKDLYVLDVKSGERTHITPHDGDVRYNSPSWGPDGDAVYCCTDRDTDTLYLGRIDLDSHEIETVESGDEWNVDGIALDDETGRFAYSRNVDGYTELTIGELTGPTEYETRPTPDLPDGTAGGVSFDPDAETFALSASSRTTNTNVHVVDFETGETTRWTRASTAGIPPSSFRGPELVHVESFDGREIPAYFTLPADAPAGETPVIVDVHGGPESQRRPSFSGLTQYLLSRGYAVFEPNVRGSTGYGKAYTHLDDVRQRMDSVKDLKAGVDWLHDHPRVDPDRIVAKGGSYGGFMVLAALTEYPDLWAAGVDVVGIANFVTFLENTGAWRREHREAEYGSLEDDREFLESISPLTHADEIEAPLFVLHGANDPRVPVGEAEQIAEEVEAQGIPVEKLIFEDEGHGISKRENQIDAYTAVVDFLDEHV